MNDLKWIITYIYLSFVNKRKRLIISFSNLEWVLTLSWQDLYSMKAAVTGFHHTRAPLYKVRGVSVLPA